MPSPEHPGCIYGEMAMCLRPCQQVVGPAEYAHEVGRVVEFLRTDGPVAAGIDRPLARPPQRRDDVRGGGAPAQALEKVQDVLRLRDELARDVDRLNGVAITPSLAPDAVEMWFVRDGNWCEPQALRLRGAGRQAGVARPQTARNVGRASRRES